jgi:hypothetical protein
MNAIPGRPYRLRLVCGAVAVATVSLFAGTTSMGAAAATPSSQPALQRWQRPPIPGPGYRPALRTAHPSVTAPGGAGGSGWAIQTIPGLRMPNGALVGESCTSAVACQAVGSYTNLAGASATLAETWDGSAWSTEPTPDPKGSAGSALSAVTCVAPDQCTAVGGYIDSSGIQLPLAEAWDGTAWKIQHVPNPFGSFSTFLSGVSCSSLTNCVAVGTAFGEAGPEALAATWNGTRWSAQFMPSPVNGFAFMSAVSCSGPDACEAVGSSNYGALAEVWNGQAWELQATPNPNQSFLSGVACPAADNCRAVGGYVDSLGNQRTLAETWNGTAWRIEATPGLARASQSVLSALSCSSTGSCMAVGESNGAAVSEIFQGTSWHLLAMPSATGSSAVSMSAVSCVRPGACSAVGSYVGRSLVSEALAYGWNGSLWKVQPTVNPRGSAASDLAADACVTANACEAVGGFVSGAGGGTLAMVWNGSSWRTQRTPNPAGAIDSVLDGVTCSAPNACTAVGSYFGAANSGTLTETWNGTTWKLHLTPNPANSFDSSFYAVSCYDANACAAVGTYFTENGPETLAEDWNGKAWRVENTPNLDATFTAALESVSCPGARACTAVGTFVDTTGTQVPVAESWNGVSWKVERTPVPQGALATALFGVSCTAADTCTAGGGHINQSQIGVTLVETWDGTSWRIQRSPSPAGSPLATIYALSCGSGACTAVGTTGIGTMALAWDGTAWKLQSTPDPVGSINSALFAVACTGATACSAVGASINPAGFESSLAEAES